MHRTAVNNSLSNKITQIFVGSQQITQIILIGAVCSREYFVTSLRYYQ
jgi:hypothetical protein